MPEKTKLEKPKIEPLESNELFTIDFCSPVKDKVQICGPNIVLKPCSPLIDTTCLPEMLCLPHYSVPICQPLIQALYCSPHWICSPVFCPPRMGMPGIPGDINELSSKVDGLRAEVEALKSKIKCQP